MYTRILARAAWAALAVLGILPTLASASMAVHLKPLPAPNIPNSAVGAASAVVSGDWIAVFGRESPFEGGGEVLLYRRGKGGLWTYAQMLQPPDADSCMDSMVMHGDMLFVACPRALDAERASNMGVVAVYALTGGRWEWVQTITSATGFFGNPGFGSSLAVSDNQLFVGYPGFAPMANSVVFGDVEIFDISALPASYQMQVQPDAWIAYSNFGSNVAASNGLLAVGANSQDVGGAGTSAGVIYTFEQADGDWFQRSVLTSIHPQPYDNFPSALAFQQSQLVAGSATNGAMNVDGSLGAAFTYGGLAGSMALNDVLMPDDAQTDTWFGQSLATVGDTVFVGEPGGGVGGHVHVYNSTATGWVHASAFSPATVQPGDAFGFALASDGHTLVITALESPSTGTGAVYVVEAPPIDQVFGDGSEL
jgi:hypothetical protein